MLVLHVQYIQAEQRHPTNLVRQFLETSHKSLMITFGYNVGLRTLQSQIRGSDIRLSPISLITDIGLSAHL